jgi:hypothetical protein
MEVSQTFTAGNQAVWIDWVEIVGAFANTKGNAA